MNIAIIPARHGSKRIPGKNSKLFHGVPVICRTIETLVKANIFDNIIVSTDSTAVADLALNYSQVSIAWRHQSLATDSANVIDVISATTIQNNLDDKDYICCVYAPNPFLCTSALEIGLETIISQPKVDYVSSVTSYNFPTQRSLHFKNETGILEMAERQFIYTHSQNLNPRFHETAQFWWARGTTWIQKSPMQLNVRGIYTPRWMVQDFDTLEDWTHGELLWEILNKNDKYMNYKFTKDNVIGSSDFSV